MKEKVKKMTTHIVLFSRKLFTIISYFSKLAIYIKNYYLLEHEHYFTFYIDFWKGFYIIRFIWCRKKILLSIFMYEILWSLDKKEGSGRIVTHRPLTGSS